MRKILFIFFLAGVLGACEGPLESVSPLEETPPSTDVLQLETDSGIQAWFIPDSEAPMVSVAFAFRGGAALDPPEKAGLSRLAMGLLDEGAGDMDATAFQTRLANLAAHLSFDAERDHLSGRLTSLRRNRMEAAALVRQALTAPRFSPEAVARVKAQMMTVLKHSRSDPAERGKKNLFARLFPDHPYGRPVGGTLKTVPSLSQADLKDFPADRLGRDRLLIGISGDLDREEAGDFLEAAFGALPEKARVSDGIAPAKPRLSGQVHTETMPVPQSALLFAQKGVKRGHPDFYPLYILNYILGGGSFSSRLVQQVREEAGLAYQISSYLASLDAAPLWVGSAGTRNKTSGETIEHIRRIWRDLHENGPRPEEVAAAKAYMVGAFPLKFDSVSGLAGRLLSMQIHDLSRDFLKKRNRMVEAVTPADVRRAAREHLDPATLTIMVVGGEENQNEKKDDDS